MISIVYILSWDWIPRVWQPIGWFPGSPGDFSDSDGEATLYAATDPCNNRHIHLSSFLVARYPPSYFNQMGANLSKALGTFFLRPPFGHTSHWISPRVSWLAAAPSGRLFGSKEMRLLMLGLDAAGKTSK